MPLDSLYGANAPLWGQVAVPAGRGDFGRADSVRNQTALVPGMACSHSASTSVETALDAYIYGHASARAGDLWGIVCTAGTSPQQSNPISTTNSDVISVLWAGYAPVLLAPGEVIRRGQFLEPIASGASQGYFRAGVAGGRGVYAVEDQDNSAGSEPALVGAIIFPEAPGEGLLALITESSTSITNTATETAFSKTVSIPANYLRVGQALRLRAKARCTSTNGTDTFKISSRVGTAAGVLLGVGPAVDVANDDKATIDLTLTVRAIGASGKVTSAGFAGTAGSTSATGSIGELTVDTTAAVVLVITGTWGAANAGNIVVLEDFVVEALN